MYANQGSRFRSSMRPGDFCCVACGAHNYSDNTSCYKCQHSRFAPNSGPVEPVRHQMPPVGLTFGPNNVMYTHTPEGVFQMVSRHTPGGPPLHERVRMQPPHMTHIQPGFPIGQPPVAQGVYSTCPDMASANMILESLDKLKHNLIQIRDAGVVPPVLNPAPKELRQKRKKPCDSVKAKSAKKKKPSKSSRSSRGRSVSSSCSSRSSSSSSYSSQERDAWQRSPKRSRKVELKECWLSRNGGALVITK